MENDIENKGRIDCLDSIRGIAASVVVLHHCWLLNSIIPPETTNKFIYLTNKFFEAGRCCVIVFFVLSGFVLATSLLQRPVAYFPYAIRRFFRIYPAFLFAVLFSVLLHYLIGFRHPISSEWLSGETNLQLSLPMIIDHLAMIGRQGMIKLDGVMWSLVHELRISFIFPLILLTLVKYRWRVLPLYLFLSFACAAWIIYTGADVGGYTEQTFLQSLISTGEFIALFAMGALLAIERERAALAIKGLTWWQHISLFAIAGYLLLKYDFYLRGIDAITVDYLHGVGAVLLIALALGVTKFGNILNHSIFVWLGRVSYSLYLVHVPIMYAVTQTIGSSWSIWRISLVVIAISLIAAEMMVRGIEKTGISFGKKLMAISVCRK